MESDVVEMLQMVDLDNSSEYAEDIDGWLSYYVGWEDTGWQLIIDYQARNGSRRREAFKLTHVGGYQWGA